MHFFLVVPTLDETEEASIIARLTKLHIQVAPGTNKAMTHIKLDTAVRINHAMVFTAVARVSVSVSRVWRACSVCVMNVLCVCACSW